MVRECVFCYWGLEIGGFVAIDIDQNTALHLIADQSLSQGEHPSLLAYYADLVSCRAAGILAISKYLVLDAFFSRNPFVSEVCQEGIEIISRLRSDADLLYIYSGPHPKRRGPKQKYQGKFNPRDLDMSHFRTCLFKRMR